jgi:hypothetical protein
MITLHLPKGSKFDLTSEISSANNIKDKNNRKYTIAGLNKIQQYL